MKINKEWIALILVLLCLLCFSAGTGFLIYKADPVGSILFGVCTLFLLFAMYVHCFYGPLYTTKTYIPLSEYTKNEYENMTVIVRDNFAIAVKGDLREKIKTSRNVIYTQSFTRKKKLIKSIPSFES